MVHLGVANTHSVAHNTFVKKKKGGSGPLGLWLDASDASTVIDTTDAGRVEEWRDKSTYGRHVSQSVLANKPNTGNFTIGGLNTVDWGGGTQILNSAIDQSFINDAAESGGVTVYMVVDTSGGFSRCYLSESNSAAAVPILTAIQSHQSGPQSRNYSQRIDDTSANVFDASGNQVIHDQIEVVFVWKLTGTQLDMYKNGGTLNRVVLGNTGTYNNFNQFSVGGLFSNSSISAHALGAKIGEIRVYTENHNESTINTIGNELATKWSQTWNNIIS